MAQNTSESSECLTEACRLEALEGKTKKIENIAQDFVSRKCQNTSTRETFTNSKTSGKTSYPEVQTHHLALQTDETYEEQSLEQFVNLNEFQKNMPQEPSNNPNFKSGETRNDSAPSIPEPLMTKIKDSNYSAETCHSGVPRDHSAYRTDETSEEKYEEESDNLNKIQDNLSDKTCNVPDTKIKHPSQNVRDPTEVIPRDLKHNIPETMTDGDIIVGHGKFKPTEPTDNATNEKPTQTVHTTKEVLSYRYLILITIFILFQSYVFTA